MSDDDRVICVDAFGDSQNATALENRILNAELGVITLTIFVVVVLLMITFQRLSCPFVKWLIFFLVYVNIQSGHKKVVTR